MSVLDILAQRKATRFPFFLVHYIRKTFEIFSDGRRHSACACLASPYPCSPGSRHSVRNGRNKAKSPSETACFSCRCRCRPAPTKAKSVMYGDIGRLNVDKALPFPRRLEGRCCDGETCAPFFWKLAPGLPILRPRLTDATPTRTVPPIVESEFVIASSSARNSVFSPVPLLHT